MNNILVSGASGIVGYGVLKSLRNGDGGYRLIGTTIYDDSIAPAFCDIFEKAPLTSDDNYVQWLTDMVRKHKLDLIIPGIEADVYKWAANVDVINATGVKILMNNPDLLVACQDKWTFYQNLKKHNTPFAIATTLNNDYKSLVEEFGLPFLLKPRKGFASKGIVIVNDENTFNAHKDRIGDVLMVQPYIGNIEEEYTASAFGDGVGGFYSFMTLRRKLSKEGFTEKAEVADLPGMHEALSVLCRIYKPVGPTNFQFRLHNGQLKLLEINPRISSSTSIRAAFGYNETKMAAEYYLENKIPVQPVIRKGRAVRYTEDHIFYEDRNNL